MTISQERQYQRADTAANWAAANPVLAAGEFGIETDTLQVKVGDGAQVWTALPYIGSPVVVNNGNGTATIS